MFCVTIGKSFERLLMIKDERRTYTRLPLTKEEKVEALYLYEQYSKKGMEADIINMSNGGFCISIAKSLVSKQLNRLDVIKVVIPVSKGLPGIPTLGEVRWVTSKDNGVEKYIIGIRFVI